MTGVVTLDQRLDSLQPVLAATSLPARLIQAAEMSNSAVLGTDNGLPLWQLIDTPLYRSTAQGETNRDSKRNNFFRQMREGQAVIAEVARRFVGEKVTELEEVGHGTEEEQTLLERWLLSPELDIKVISLPFSSIPSV